MKPALQRILQAASDPIQDRVPLPMPQDLPNHGPRGDLAPSVQVRPPSFRISLRSTPAMAPIPHLEIFPFQIPAPGVGGGEGLPADSDGESPTLSPVMEGAEMVPCRGMGSPEPPPEPPPDFPWEQRVTELGPRGWEPPTDGSPMDRIQELLGAIATQAKHWQGALDRVILQIQWLYREGPLIDGWLESRTVVPESSPWSSLGPALHLTIAPLLRDSLDLPPLAPAINPPESLPSLGISPIRYQLCGVDREGQPWSCPCPADQVPQVSLAIARHQKLQQLLHQRQSLEERCHTLMEQLTRLQEPML